MICHRPDKFDDYRHDYGGDMFLICHVILRDHMFKVLYKFMGVCPSK